MSKGGVVQPEGAVRRRKSAGHTDTPELIERPYAALRQEHSMFNTLPTKHSLLPSFTHISQPAQI